MGLDISICTTRPQALSQAEPDYFDDLQALSRTFCRLILRQHNLEGGEEPALDQLGRLVEVDVAPLYAMETYAEVEELEWRLETAAGEEGRQAVLDHAERAKAALAGNLGVVLATVDALLSRLAAFSVLPHRLISTRGYESYLADFAQDVGYGYIGNNLGQDLRIFQFYAMRKATAGWTRLGPFS